MRLHKSIGQASAVFALSFSCAGWAQEAPESVYRKFHDALIAGDLNEIRKWGTTEAGNQLASMPAGERQAMLAFMGGVTPKAYAVTAKNVNGDKATLWLCARATENGKVDTLSAKVELVKESGAWKVLEEQWGGVQPPLPSTQPCPSPVEPARRAKLQ